MRRRFSFSRLRSTRFTLFLLGIASVLMVGMFSHSAIAAKENVRAPIVLDGERLFQISESGQFSADERADPVNLRLQELVNNETTPRVEVAKRNNLTTILIDGQHLLTVTDRDALPGRSPREQAEIWARQISTALRQAHTDRSPQYLQHAVLVSITVVAIALGLQWAMIWFWRRSLLPTLNTLVPAANENGDPSRQRTALDLFVKLLRTLIRSVLWLGTLLYITNLYPVTRHWSYRITSVVINSLISPILTLGQSQYSIVDLALLAAVLFCLVIGSRIVTDLFKSRVLGLTGVNRGAQEAVAILIHYSLIFIGSLVLLQIWGLDISSLAILASALGVGIGFGLQDIAKNFGSGLVLVFERPIQVGDFVEVGNFQGMVERIGARSTLIRTLDQISIIVPNSRFLEQEVINWSHSNPISRLHIPVGVAYGSDLETVKTILLDAAKSQPGVLSVPQPQVFFKGFGDSSLELELLVWTAEPSKQVPLKSELYFRLDTLLRQHNIEIPFPQTDLNLRGEHVPIKLSPQLEAAIAQFLAQSSQRNGNH